MIHKLTIITGHIPYTLHQSPDACREFAAQTVDKVLSGGRYVLYTNSDLLLYCLGEHIMAAAVERRGDQPDSRARPLPRERVEAFYRHADTTQTPLTITDTGGIEWPQHDAVREAVYEARYALRRQLGDVDE